MFLFCVLSFMKFEGQTSKNVHDVRKVCREMTLCVLVSFVKFYVFVFYEDDVGGTRLLYGQIKVRNVRENIPKDRLRVIDERSMLVAKTA